MRLCLAAMPWLALDTPSLAVGILRRRTLDACPSVSVGEYHGGLRWAECLLAADGALTPDAYMRIADRGLAHGLGDWVFAGALHDDPAWRLPELRAYARQWECDHGLAERMRQLAHGFVVDAAREILDTDPDVVGFTTTFMQTVPSLAVARELKRRRPDVRTVFGGASCDGPMGHALHRNHRFVDAVVRGEGELALPALLEHLAAGTAPRDVPGLCWWDGERSVANPEPTGGVPPDLVPVPDYDDWFADLAASPVAEYLSPYLFVEGSRGCWWGEKHQCTFCGLNGSSIAFRSKPAERFWAELRYLVEQHRVLDVMTADNIIDMAYYRELLPRMAEVGWDLRLHYEAKANVTDEQLAGLADAGLCGVQFGMESLSSRVLRIMDKGTTAAANVRVLRGCEEQHLTTKWNHLYGFPGERDSDYRSLIGQLPALVHLQPPARAGRIALERFSPYFERPELGFAERRPAAFHRLIHDLPEVELRDLAYFFDSPERGITGDVERDLLEAVERWQADHPDSSLLLTDGPGDTLTVQDRRRGWPSRDHTLTGWRRTAYLALRRGRSVASLHRYLAGQGHPVEPAELAGWVADCLRRGLLFEDGDTYVALATRGVPVRLDGRPAGPPAVELAVPQPWSGTAGSGAPGPTLRLIAALRDRQTERVEVRWQADLDPRLDITLLHHLPPPTARAGEPEAVRCWRAAYRPARCYYRVGPGFVTVRDVRHPERAARYVLGTEALVSAFTRLLHPGRLDDLPPAERTAAEALAAERLVAVLDGWAVTLPSRMRRWPVPCHRA